MFSLVFCSYLWNLTQWFDTYLIQALYPKLGDVPGMGGILGMGVGVISGINEIFVDIITGTLYIVLPLLWMSIMGWAGYQAGIYLTGLFNAMASPANQAGEKAGNRVGRFL